MQTRRSLCLNRTFDSAVILSVHHDLGAHILFDVDKHNRYAWQAISGQTLAGKYSERCRQYGCFYLADALDGEVAWKNQRKLKINHI